MSENTTIARPYAKAVFNVAIEQRQLVAWSKLLQIFAQAVLEPVAADFIQNPASTVELHVELLDGLVDSSQFEAIETEAKNFVRLLAQNKRLLLLPEMYVQFEIFRAEQEKTLTVQVTSFGHLSAVQQQQMSARLSQRLQRQVTLDLSVDKSLLGGAVIQAGDLVIDGSIRGKLNKLAQTLVA